MLYRLCLLLEASPKAISRRTSYLCVRLEFHRYPRFIRKLFNAHRFGPPRIFTCASTWTWVDHCGFGSISLPSRGSFHISLTVLCAIGRQLVFSLGGWSPLLPTEFLVLRGTLDTDLKALPFAYRALTFYRLPSQVVQLSLALISSVLNPHKP